MPSVTRTDTPVQNVPEGTGPSIAIHSPAHSPPGAHLTLDSLVFSSPTSPNSVQQVSLLLVASMAQMFQSLPAYLPLHTSSSSVNSFFSFSYLLTNYE